MKCINTITFFYKKINDDITLLIKTLLMKRILFFIFVNTTLKLLNDLVMIVKEKIFLIGRATCNLF